MLSHAETRASPGLIIDWLLDRPGVGLINWTQVTKHKVHNSTGTKRPGSGHALHKMRPDQLTRYFPSFLLPDGSIRSPDASLVRQERWQALSEAERDGFPPLCPDLVVELASPSNQPEPLRLKMASYISNGAQLGWLLLPRQRSVEIWSADSTTRAARFSALDDASRLEAAAEFPGLVIDLEEIWAG